jgi:hypothetical protein
MRASIAAILLASALTVLSAGCGRSQSDSTPVACLDGAGTYLAALEGAPAQVRLSGDTPISECLVDHQSNGTLATVGEAMIEAGTKLNAEARAKPGGSANLQLGYLVGAAQKGGDGTDGIHVELFRRLAVAARFSPGRDPLSQAFLSTYRQGYDAGQAHG